MDAFSIQSAIGSLKTAHEIGKALLDVRDSNLIATKIGELNRKLLEAYDFALSAKAAHSDMIDTKRALEEKIRSFETWNTEKERYELKEIQSNRFAYVIKESMQGPEPKHCLCTNCHDQGKKSIMQRGYKDGGGMLGLQCSACKNFINAVLG